MYGNSLSSSYVARIRPSTAYTVKCSSPEAVRLSAWLMTVPANASQPSTTGISCSAPVTSVITIRATGSGPYTKPAPRQSASHWPGASRWHRNNSDGWIWYGSKVSASLWNLSAVVISTDGVNPPSGSAKTLSLSTKPRSSKYQLSSSHLDM